MFNYFAALPFNVDKGLPRCDIIYHNDSMSASIVGGSNCTKAFLTSSVPDLKFDPGKHKEIEIKLFDRFYLHYLHSFPQNRSIPISRNSKLSCTQRLSISHFFSYKLVSFLLWLTNTLASRNCKYRRSCKCGYFDKQVLLKLQPAGKHRRSKGRGTATSSAVQFSYKLYSCMYCKHRVSIFHLVSSLTESSMDSLEREEGGLK